VNIKNVNTQNLSLVVRVWIKTIWSNIWRHISDESID
jgi:hypothetical protein